MSVIFLSPHNAWSQGISNPTHLFPAHDSANDLYGYINNNGTWVIKPVFKYAEPFSEGLAVVEVKGAPQTKGYIDKSGKVVIQPIYLSANKFSDGHCLVEWLNRGKNKIDYIFISRSFEKIPLPEEVTSAFPLHDEMSLVGVKGLWGYVDSKGIMKIKPQYKGAGHFSEGLAAATLDGKRWGYIDKNGTWSIKPAFEDAKPFADGLAPASIKSKEFEDPDLPGFILSKFGYVNKKGEWVIKPQFDDADPFSEGLAPAAIESQWGQVNQVGKWVISPNNRSCRPFKEGLCVTKNEEGFVYYDKNGVNVFGRAFFYAESFQNGLAKVADGPSPKNSTYYIQAKGIRLAIPKLDK